MSVEAVALPDLVVVHARTHELARSQRCAGSIERCGRAELGVGVLQGVRVSA